jgi:hypothetical protein
VAVLHAAAVCFVKKNDPMEISGVERMPMHLEAPANENKRFLGF